MPKLAVLWAALAAGLVLISLRVLVTAALPRGPGWIWYVDVPVAAFLVLNIAAWAFSTDRVQSLYGERLSYQGLLTLLLYVGFFAFARLTIADDRGLRLLTWAVAGGATLVAGYALVQKAGLDPIWEGYLPGGRVFSSIGQANALAAYFVLAIPVTLALLVGSRTIVRLLVLLASAAMVAALVLTQSRGGFLGFLAVLASLAVGGGLLVRLPVSRRRFGVGVVVAVALAAIVAAGVSASGNRERVSSADSSIRFHLDAWRVAVEVAAEHPLLGTGPETFPDVFPRYSHLVLPGDRATALDAFRVESPHNVYLGIAAGSGIPALLAYLAVIAGFFVATVRAARSASRERQLVLVAFLAAVTGHLVTDAFMSPDVTSTWLTWVLLGAVLGAISQPVRHSSTFQVRP